MSEWVRWVSAAHNGNIMQTTKSEWVSPGGQAESGVDIFLSGR